MFNNLSDIKFCIIKAVLINPIFVTFVTVDSTWGGSQFSRNFSLSLDN